MIVIAHKQVLIIHGGSVHSSYADYVQELKTRKFDLERLKYKLDWKDSIAADLGDEYEVLVPSMPNKTNAKYKEWKIWFEWIVPLLKNDVILVGHSLGGIFLAKYLSWETLPKKIKAVVLVAAPFGGEFKDLGSFYLPKSLSRFNNQANKIILIHSQDDPVVPTNQAKLYNEQLSNSEVLMFKKNGHFNQEHFPELLTLIKSL